MFLQQSAWRGVHRQSLPRRCKHRCAAAPAWNPQNTPDPIVMPSPSFSPSESVEVQLKALRTNDEPWLNHGIQTAYEFAADAGGMERSKYFGFSKDLYHLDHFLGMFGNMLGDLINNQSHELLQVAEPEAGVYVVRVRVVGPTGREGEYDFRMVRKELGRKAGSWMTKSVLKAKA
ncbi:hypothetical protein PLESTB_000037600 [Pleodorina starrii]|uniref:Uncharacterized protein n=1 Tax=Pleodorina starrii TaxID=330485 RepID=A0A9W6B974_9CHLO|nr:hypothetical protein PLESTM_001095700 [Pleodorina starrii]GLC47898.1 hypothetical protein PLESTB_000037600 [Pleodorina starrii]GLC70670.1 hypothetical protein PLESTF_001020100 [Pleodorina starrii]